MHKTTKIVFSSITIIFVLFSVQQVKAFEVMHAGALKNFMWHADISSQFKLRDLERKKGLYALGALENLEGEIQIFNGEVFNTYTSQGKVEFDKSFQRDASLLVYTVVNDWQSQKLPSSVDSRKQLEENIEIIANQSGINTEEAFPFLLTGKAKTISWHVINWDKNDRNHTHKKHTESGPHGTIQNTEVTILGFFSKKHKAIFTHHSTNLHMHFKTADNNLAGHIDDLVIGNKMVLMLPRE